MFHIFLKRVTTNASLTEIIIQQHPGLKANKSNPWNLAGRSTGIDDVVKKETLWNCWVILTSRETEQIKNVKQYMDAETEIHGFDKASVKIFTEQTLQSPEKCEQLLKDAAENGLC